MHTETQRQKPRPCPTSHNLSSLLPFETSCSAKRVSKYAWHTFKAMALECSTINRHTKSEQVSYNNSKPKPGLFGGLAWFGSKGKGDLRVNFSFQYFGKQGLN